MNKVVTHKIPNMSNEALIMNITLEFSKGNSISMIDLLAHYYIEIN